MIKVMKYFFLKILGKDKKTVIIISFIFFILLIPQLNKMNLLNFNKKNSLFHSKRKMITKIQ